MAENLTDWVSLGAASLSAIATAAAWCTARSALRVAQETEKSASEEKLLTAQERYQLAVARLRMQASALIATANDAKTLIAARSVDSGGFGSSRTTQALNDVEAFQRVAEDAKLLLTKIDAGQTDGGTLAQISEAHKQVHLVLIPVEAALARVTYLRGWPHSS